MSRRTERLASVIQQELAVMILHQLNDPRVPAITSITRVSVAEDLSVADVYVSIMGTEGQQSAALIALRHSAGIMRTHLTKALTTRTTPFLKFHIDENLKKELAMLELLKRVSDENAEIDRKRAEAAAAEAPQPPEEQPGGIVPPASPTDQGPQATDH